MTTDTEDTTEPNRTTITRRGALSALAAGAAGALVGAVGANSHREAVSLGGNSRESVGAGKRYGGFSVAPTTLPPKGSNVLWARGEGFSDDSAIASIVDDSARSWVASGLGWSVASDIGTARSNLPQEPGIIAAPTGDSADVRLVYSSGGSTSWETSGVEIVIASSSSAATSEWSGSTPAVLFSPGDAPDSSLVTIKGGA